MIDHIEKVTPTLLFADKSPLVTEAVLSLLQSAYSVVGVYRNGEDALAATDRLRPDFAVLDLCLPVIDGITVAKRLKLVGSATRIVLTALIEDDEFIVEARSVAHGYVLKQRILRDLPIALTCAANGCFFSSNTSPEH
jgi:DNA-binding NarL/FixJ family response regulator